MWRGMLLRRIGTDERQGFSEEEVAAYWNVNAGPWAQEVREGRDVARECLNNPAFLGVGAEP